jgi:hypothetical protein
VSGGHPLGGRAARWFNLVVSRYMAPFHIAMSVVLVLCAIGALASGWLWSSPGSLALSILLGYWVTLVVMFVAAALLVLLAVRAFSGNASAFIRRSWLGLVNGGLSLAAYVLVFGQGAFHK